MAHRGALRLRRLLRLLGCHLGNLHLSLRRLLGCHLGSLRLLVLLPPTALQRALVLTLQRHRGNLHFLALLEHVRRHCVGMPVAKSRELVVLPVLQTLH